jgi:ketosteroid isomerase-like protein
MSSTPALTTTRETIESYFAALRQRQGWQDLLADDMVFTSFTSPVRELRGRDAYLPGTKRFYDGIQSFELRELMVDGDRAVALTRYEIKAPGDRPPFSSDVAEVYRVREAKIVSFGIYFDTAPYPK